MFHVERIHKFYAAGKQNITILLESQKNETTEINFSVWTFNILSIIFVTDRLE